jgi:hypothetical protein
MIAAAAVMSNTLPPRTLRSSVRDQRERDLMWEGA